MNGIKIENFSLKIREKDTIKHLLERVYLEIPLGSVFLLVGASGSGKSTLLKLLTGLITPLTPQMEMQGSFQLLGQELMQLKYPQELHREVGLVFQDFALFDDFSPKENILFTGQISEKYSSPLDLENHVQYLSEQLGVEDALGVKEVSSLSGGQKQRIAMCRLLVATPRVMIFDEPTSGLDPSSARKAAKLILGQATSDKIIIIVTHDYRPFLEEPSLSEKIDRIGILDGSGSLYCIHPSGRRIEAILRDIQERLEGITKANRKKLAHRECMQKAWQDFLCKIFRLSQAIFALRYAFLPSLKQREWHWKLACKIFLVSIIQAMPFIFMSGFLLGMLATYFSLSENFGELQKYLDPLLFSQALSAIGKVSFVVICPLFTAVFMATRSGAAISGYLGNLVLTRQIDAYKVYGIQPERLFLDKIVWAFGTGFFVLSSIAFIGFMMASLFIVLLLKEAISYQEWHVAFHQLLGVFPFYHGWGWFILKTVSTGVATGLASYLIGASEKKNSQELTHGITKCVMINILLVLLIFFAILMLEKKF
ncbi:MAG: ATP-binding cassette domain-containing protein [Candidatus Brocadiae bacterium]|nr:ATP-binding cassette domain-containing protein [Candidatus Brocadiia bacterium]